jgi:hypothetical protein
MDSKKKHKFLKQQVSSRHPGLQFLIEEIVADTSKIDIIQNTSYDYNNMVEEMIGHYQKLQDLDEGFPDLIKKSSKKKKGKLFKSGGSDEE